MARNASTLYPIILKGRFSAGVYIGISQSLTRTYSGESSEKVIQMRKEASLASSWCKVVNAQIPLSVNKPTTDCCTLRCQKPLTHAENVDESTCRQ